MLANNCMWLTKKLITIRPVLYYLVSSFIPFFSYTKGVRLYYIHCLVPYICQPPQRINLEKPSMIKNVNNTFPRERQSQSSDILIIGNIKFYYSFFPLLLFSIDLFFVIISIFSLSVLSLQSLKILL